MTTEQERQSFYRYIVKRIKEAKSAEELCRVAKALLGMAISEDYRSWIRNVFEQKISELGLFREVPRDIADARTVLQKGD